MTDPNQLPEDMADADAVVTRSEEELWITTRPRGAWRARLTKYVETEMSTIPLRREQVRIEYAPISGEASARGKPGPAPPPNGEPWLVLYDEEVIVERRWVARERVKLSTISVTEDLEISETLRREEIEFDDNTDGG